MSIDTNKAYLLLGGNTGDRLFYLQSAMEALGAQAGKLLQTSSLYETAAWGIQDQPSFYNCVLVVETPLDAYQLLDKILAIEKSLGRQRTENSHWRERPIDIDILFFNEEVIRAEHLKVPHSHLHERRFTLEPLNEIAPSLLHPVLKRTVSELLEACPDPLPVKKLDHAL